MSSRFKFFVPFKASLLGIVSAYYINRYFSTDTEGYSCTLEIRIMCKIQAVIDLLKCDCDPRIEMDVALKTRNGSILL